MYRKSGYEQDIFVGDERYTRTSHNGDNDLLYSSSGNVPKNDL